MQILMTPPTPISTSSAALADWAVQALLHEVHLTPKPGLVDRRGSGCHPDMSLGLMCRSAAALRGTFKAMADAATGQRPNLHLRAELARIGRDGEAVMLQATGGVNTHRGAVWTLGLLIGAVAAAPDGNAAAWASFAGQVARFPDRAAPPTLRPSHGEQVRRHHGVGGAREEACNGFPHLIQVALPALRAARDRNLSEQQAQLETLIALMGRLDDTCVLHRGGPAALRDLQTLAVAIGEAGGHCTPAGAGLYTQLESLTHRLNISPGGSADLLAATLLLDTLEQRTWNI